MSTTVTSKGQVTIPKALRDVLGLKPGSKVDFAIGANGEIVLKKIDGIRKTGTGRFDKFRGLLGPSPSTDEIMAMLRGDD